jgi:flagellar FliL protein
MVEAVAEAAHSKEKKRSLGKILLLGVNALLFIAGVAFFVLTKFGIFHAPDTPETMAQPQTQVAQEEHKPAPAPPASHGSPHGSPPAEAQPGESVTVPLQAFVVNLSGENGRRYLRLVVQLQVRGAKAKEEIERHAGKVRDRLIFLLSSKTFEALSTSEGKYQLQAEITKNLNDALGVAVVEKAYFTEFVVQ